MNTQDITVDEIEQELKRRQDLEVIQFFAEIAEHRKAIKQIERLLSEIGEVAFEPPPGAEIGQAEAPKTFGPCATRILDILQSSSVAIPSYKLATITKYSSPMLKKALRELLAANRIQQVGDSRPPVYQAV